MCMHFWQKFLQHYGCEHESKKREKSRQAKRTVRKVPVNCVRYFFSLLLFNILSKAHTHCSRVCVCNRECVLKRVKNETPSNLSPKKAVKLVPRMKEREREKKNLMGKARSKIFAKQTTFGSTHAWIWELAKQNCKRISARVKKTTTATTTTHIR